MGATMRIPVNNAVIQWAIKNGEKSEAELLKKYDLHTWENPTSTRDYPTFKQIQNFSHDTRIPFNYFFKQTLPQEEHAFAKFRTINNVNVQPSRRLIETIQAMESYQAWMKDFLLNQDKTTQFQLLASVKSTMNIDKVAQQIIKILHLENLTATKLTDDAFFSSLRSRLSKIGVMIMQSGIVGTNTHRPLDVNEFRAFVLVDNVIPLIFINSTDSKKAKIFSLIHEFVHILLGDNEVLNVSPETEIHQERWINQITSAVLMPAKEVRAALSTSVNHQNNLIRLSQLFHTSLVATAIRLKLLNIYGEPEVAWAKSEQKNQLELKTKSSGGNFYHTAISRLDLRFASAVINDEATGKLASPEAARMLGVSLKTYDETVNKILELA